MIPRKVCISVSGDFALFTDPLTGAGGEKCSYPIPTYGAIKGLLDNIYWKPTFQWVVDRVRVMNPVEMEAISIKTLNFSDGKNDLFRYTYVTNPHYIIEAHIEWDLSKPQFKNDRSYKKHYPIFLESLKKGGRLPIRLGTSECPCFIESAKFSVGKGYYDNKELVVDKVMFHSYLYRQHENHNFHKHHKPEAARYWTPKVTKGVINFVRPEKCKIVIPVF